jgi:hypothetical protein
MFGRWNTYCAALAACALVSCSTYRDLRDWWSRDTGPTEAEWAAFRAQYAYENEPPPRATADRRDNALAPRSSPDAKVIQDSRAAPLTPQPPRRMAKAAPPVRKILPDTPAAPTAPPASEPEPPVPAEKTVAVEVPILTPKLSSVTGMSEASLRQALGAPSSATQTGTQKIWRYAGNGCSVEILLFRDVTRNTYAALDHRTLTRDGRPSSRPCLRYAPAPDQSG